MKTLARNLRKQSTDAEKLLWKNLRGCRMEGYKFRRQLVIEPYIVDFVCLEAKLIVEADGGQHAEHLEDDAKRTQLLQAMGYTVMRFWNNEILNKTEAVLENIRSILINTPHPDPLPEGEGE